MNVIITPARLHGRIKAIASKSSAHRLLICAALADQPTVIQCEEVSRDIEATAESLMSLGADIRYDERTGIFRVLPRKKHTSAEGTDQTARCVLDVGESGSTLRFLLPVVCALGVEAYIVRHGSLINRPLADLWKELEHHGCILSVNPDGSIKASGKLRGGEFRIPADISSQYISGLLFAVSVMSEGSHIKLRGEIESEGYIRMTIRALEQFGVHTDWIGDVLKTSGTLCSPGIIRVERDWSNGAFWEIAGMLTDGGAGGLTCTELDETSVQGDRAVRKLKWHIAEGDSVIDARDIPDLVPVLSVQAAVSPGTTVFLNAGRLRIKESDRIKSTVRMLNDLGGIASETSNGLIVRGQKTLRGGCVDSCNDHRIAMSAAVASIACEEKVVITGAEAVNKSYPKFWEDFARLGGNIKVEEQ